MYFEDLAVGDQIPSISKGPMSTAHIMRWSAAMENWHRIHYDKEYATKHDGLPDVLVNGSWKQHVLIQLLTDWVGEDGWLVSMSFQYRNMNVPGETLTAWGEVTGKDERDGLGYVSLNIGLKNGAGIESSPGTAQVAVALRGGREVPYPYASAGA